MEKNTICTIGALNYTDWASPVTHHCRQSYYSFMARTVPKSPAAEGRARHTFA